MHVILGHERQIEIDDQRQVRDVEAAGREVGGHQHANATGLEVVEHAAACALALVTVYHAGAHATPCQVLADAVCAALGPAEHQRLTCAVLREDVREDVPLALDGHVVHLMAYRRGDYLPGRHIDAHGITRELSGEPGHGVGEGCREEERLAAARQGRRDAPQGG
jgi:hypothetical protein